MRQFAPPVPRLRDRQRFPIPPASPMGRLAVVTAALWALAGPAVGQVAGGQAAPRVLEVAAAGVDVDVSLAPGPASTAPVEVVAWSPECGELGRITAGPGVAGVTVPGVLGQVTGACGVQYEVRLEDGFGVAVGEALPFRVGLECGGGQCSFALAAGLSAVRAVVLPVSLDDALVAAGGAPDLVAAVVAASPNLTNAALSHALEVETGLGAQGLELGSPCACLWAGAVQAQEYPEDPRLRSAAAWACRVEPSDDADRTTTLKARRLCYTAGQGSSSPLSLPGGQSWEPLTLAACLPPVLRRESAVLGVAARLDVEAGGDSGVAAYAVATATFFVDGEVAEGPHGLAAASGAADPEIDMDSGLFAMTPTVGAEVGVTSEALAEVLLDEVGTSDGRAKAVSGFRIRFEVPTDGASVEAGRSINNTDFGGPDPVPCRDEPDET